MELDKSYLITVDINHTYKEKTNELVLTCLNFFLST